MLREHDDGAAGVVAAYLQPSDQPLVRVGGRHPDVGHQEIEDAFGDVAEQVDGVDRGGDDVEASCSRM